MSEIDFEAIEKAMAELVSKAQGQKRESQLKVVTDKRNEQAKKLETAHEQGNIATKRIIISSNRLRSNPHSFKAAKEPQIRNLGPNDKNMQNERLISDFRPLSSSVNSNSSKMEEPRVGFESESIKSEPSKTVGALSDEYLLEKVAEDNEDNFFQEEPPEDVETNYAEDSSVENANHSTDEDAGLESIVGPSSHAESTFLESPQTSSAERVFEEDLPEADEYTNSVGNIHKIYGQHLSSEHSPRHTSVTKENSVHPKAKSSKKSVKTKKGRGFLFYFLVLVIIFSILIWMGAAYLYLSA